MHEFLDGRLVGPIVARRPERMRLVQGSVVEDLLVDGTGRHKYESIHVGRSGRFDQLDGSEDVFLQKRGQIAFTAAETTARMEQSGVNHRVATGQEPVATAVAGQFALDPFDVAGRHVETLAVGRPPVPATATVAGSGQSFDDIASNKPGRPGNGNFHGNLHGRMVRTPGCRYNMATMQSSSPGSFRLFRLFGIDVFLHWSWFIVALIQYRWGSGRFDNATWHLLTYVSLFGIVLLHEFGHSLA